MGKMEKLYFREGRIYEVNYMLLFDSEFKLRRLMLGRRSEFNLPPDVAESDIKSTWMLAEKVESVLKGELFELPIEDLDTAGISKFNLLVLKCLRQKVPVGKVISYRKLAELAGNSKAARAVGGAMRTNPFPLFFPCHRVVNSNREPGNYGPGKEIKKNLLRWEGIEFGGDGKIPCKYFSQA
jgi:O-6-methylguanine DNA methyltransferase